MIFYSPDFLLFLPAVLVICFLVPKRVQNIWLLIASLLFYASGGIQYLPFLLLSVTVSYFCALACEKYPDRKRIALLIWVVWGLGLLFAMKYLPFAYSLLSRFLGILGISGETPRFSTFLPIGISFYTFSTIGYLMDVYRGKIKAERNFIDYGLFVTFFPYVLSGPIERAGQILPQIKAGVIYSFENIRQGAYRMLWGYFLKLVIAERLGIFVDRVYGEYQAYAGVHLLIATVLFAFQLCADFAGYSEIAMGAAKMLGIDVMQNFKAPYFARSVSEFFKRWHISLNRWFVDYLYIPLGGNRKGKWRKYLNVMITFIFSGLWHGAGLCFVVWGGLNGLYMVVGDMTGKARESFKRKLGVRTECFSYRLWQALFTFAAVDLAWLFFRADSLRTGLGILQKIFLSFRPESLIDRSLLTMGLDGYDWMLLCVSMVLWLIVDSLREKGNFYRKFLEQNLLFRYLIFMAGLFGILVFGVYGPDFAAGTFLYFQF